MNLSGQKNYWLTIRKYESALDRFLSVPAPMLWNTLSDKVRQPKSDELFKISFKHISSYTWLSICPNYNFLLLNNFLRFHSFFFSYVSFKTSLDGIGCWSTHHCVYNLFGPKATGVFFEISHAKLIFIATLDFRWCISNQWKFQSPSVCLVHLPWRQKWRSFITKLWNKAKPNSSMADSRIYL